MPTSAYTASRFTFDQKRELVWRVLGRYFQDRFQIKGKILDLGCGYGQFIKNLASETRYAFDIDPGFAKYLDESIQFRSGKLSELPTSFETDRFDWVLISNFLEHLERGQISALFADLKRIMNSGGQMLILMPNYSRCSKEYFDDFTHVTPISGNALKDWLTSFGFEITFFHPGFMPFSVKDSRLPITEFLIKAWLASPVKPGGKQLLLIARKPAG
ncbi:MAG TPA: class I SAM-dependent methyltransferase [Bdellovibrionota bacterium]|nr:class I SAM-dependent methyltransferase [Bdellovibrionota bacterium]